MEKQTTEVGPATAGPAAPPEAVPAGPRRGRSRGPEIRRFLIALAFLAPALLALGALLVYPIFFSIVRSLFDARGNEFIGLANYEHIVTNPRSLTMLRNNLIWVVFAPTIATTLGLIFAVLAEKVRWATAFKVVVFMPMAISMLAAGVIFRLAYEGDPERGLMNAAARAVVDVVRQPGPYPGARPSVPEAFTESEGGWATETRYAPGDVAPLGLVAVPRRLIPEDATQPELPEARADVLAGVVWFDFTAGGSGEAGAVDPGEQGLPDATVEVLDDGEVVATTTSALDGSFAFEGLEPGDYRLRLAEATFREPFGGANWLGPLLVTPSIILSFIWMWTGFAMVIIGAGLASINREVLEAARVDGANEWQVFRRITVPLLSPVLVVVLVTLVINVLKIFDLVVVIAPGPVIDDANVIAVEMWRVAFGGARNHGLGSALAISLFLLVLPAMIFNLRRFRAEQ